MSSNAGDSGMSQKFVVYSFSGSKERFQEWKTKTLSLSRVHKVYKYLTTEIEDIPDEDEAEDWDSTSSEYKKYEKNVKADDLLVRSCTGTPLGLIEKVEEGNAHEAWKALLKEYETSDDDVHELEAKWIDCKLSNFGTNPTDWFLKLDRINRLLESIGSKYRKDEIQYSGHIIKNMCSEYKTVVTSLVTSGKSADLEAIQDAVKKHWKEHGEGSKGGELSEAFYLEGGKKFQGVCNYCKKPGHKWKDCFKRKADAKNGNGGRNPGNNFRSGSGGGRNYRPIPNFSEKKKCWLCGGDHLKKDCKLYRNNKQQGRDERNELNHVFDDGIFMCEYVKVNKPSYKDVVVLGEINLSVPTQVNEEELIGKEEFE